MPDSDLYKKLKSFDPKLAQVYFDVTRDDPRSVIDEHGVEKLFVQTLDKDAKITEGELNALILIIQECAFTPDGMKMELAIVTNKVVIEALSRGVGKRLTSDQELGDTFAALDLAASSVNFTSPRTGIAYNASKYQAVKQLIKDKNIIVIAVQDRGIVYGDIRPRGAPAEGAFALFDPDSDPPVIFIADSKSSSGKLSKLAHELTHAIQNFGGIPRPAQFFETDAYIVQFLVLAKENNKPLPPQHPITPCVDIIQAGKAKTSNDAWEKAYYKAVEAVEKIALASHTPQRDPKAPEKRAKWTKVLQVIEKANAKPAPTAPTPVKPAPAKPAPVAPKK